jgi:arylsulfatase A-like enzyme
MRRTSRVRPPFGAICFVFALLFFSSEMLLGADDPRPPNVVLFLVDDMGWIDCGAYGSEYYETPHVDALATRGMLFTDAYSANPLCSPTRASILTGKYPARLGITSAVGHQPPRPPGTPRLAESAPANRPIILPESLRYLDPAEYTLAEALHDAGYATGHFGKWHLGLTEEYWPERQGYDVAFHGAPDPGPPSPNGYFSPYSFRAGTVTPGPEGEYIVDRVTDEAIRFMKSHRDGPFFAAVWQYGVHGPWDFKHEYVQEFVDKVDPRGKQGNPVMAAMLRSIDESLGRIVDTIDELGLSDDTIILFASDNGGNVHSNTESDRRKANVKPGHPQWRSLSSYHQYAGFLPPTNNAPLRAGKGTLYEGGVRIPVMAVWPGRILANTRSSELVSTIDFYPTLVDLTGTSLQQEQAFDGVSLAGLLTGKSEALEREAVFNYFPHGGPSKPPGVTVRQGNWKLIRWFETGPDYPSIHELYDLQADIGETVNLADKKPEVVAALDARIDAFLKETGAVTPQPNPAYRGDSAAPTDALLGWVPKSCTTSLDGEFLQVAPDGGRSPFLARVRLRGEGDLELRAKVRTTAEGTGRIQWRTADQKSFPRSGQTVDFDVQEGEQEIAVPFSVDERLVHLRFYLPPQLAAIDIDWLELWQRSNPPQRLIQWDFHESE